MSPSWPLVASTDSLFSPFAANYRLVTFSPQPSAASDTAARLSEAFRARFGSDPIISRAPGRVNIIGDHTDYNDGFVLPAAVDRYCWVAASPRTDGRLVVYAENNNHRVEADLDSLDTFQGEHWARYPFGVAWALQQAGRPIRPCNLLIHGEVPIGSGLSSSAAIEVSTALALLSQANPAHNLDRTQLALICQRAENEFVGARCGIMDQFIAAHGRADSALTLDCRSLEFQPVQLPANIAIVVCNSMVKHEIAASGYNTRRAECEEGVRRLQSLLPQNKITALRDVSLSALELHSGDLPETIYRRCRHVTSENARVLDAVASLERNDLQSLAQLMAASHKSLRDDFEVSCPELDILVELAADQPSVFGSRMMGGGFGGCTIHLVANEAVEMFIADMQKNYEARTGIHPEIYNFHVAQGAETLDSK
jgi:galactokinase